MSNLALSKRSYEIQASPIRKLVPLAVKAKNKGITVYHLNIGQPDISTPYQFWEVLKNYKDEVLSYGPSQGIDDYLESLVSYYLKYNIKIKKEEIVATVGGSEALLFAFMIVANPGEEIIVFEPFYTNYNGFATMAGVNLKPIQTKVEDGFHLPSKDKIEAKINDKTKAILICSPNNPTGTILTLNEMEMICDLALKHNLFIISDEVYREFAYENKPLSILSFPQVYDRAILLDSISKRFSACGARIGSLISYNKEIIESAIKMGQARLCPPTIEQYAAQSVYKLDDSYYKGVIEEYKRRRDITYEKLMQIKGVICQKPEGAFYIMAKIPVKDSEDFARWLLEEFQYNNETVMIAPGPGFYVSEGKGIDEIRIAYVLKCEKLAKAMELLKIAIEEYNS